MTSKPWYELELIAYFSENGQRAIALQNPNAVILLDGQLVAMPRANLEPTSEAAAAIKDHIFAEVNIPYHLPTAAYLFICHVLNRLNDEPAILEILLLQQAAPDLVARYHQLCQYKGELEEEPHA